MKQRTSGVTIDLSDTDLLRTYFFFGTDLRETYLFLSIIDVSNELTNINELVLLTVIANQWLTTILAFPSLNSTLTYRNVALNVVGKLIIICWDVDVDC